MALNNNYFDNFFTVGLNDITEETFKDVEFQGFNPKVVRSQLIKRKWSKDELNKILAYYLVRGTNIDDKAYSRSSPECVNLLNALKNKGLLRRAVKKEDITIGRIVAAMPEVVASIIAKHPENCRILCPEYGVTIPQYMKFSSGASLCTTDDELEDWCTWAIEQDKIINPNNYDSDRVRQFATIQFESDLFSLDKRVEIRSKLEMIESEHE